MRRIALVAVLTSLFAACSMLGPTADGSGDFADVPGVGRTRVDVPRPTGKASAPCDEDPLPPVSDAPIETRVVDLRRLGLFGGRPDTSDAALIDEVTRSLADRWGDPADVPAPLLDLAIAEHDSTRVWWRDLEADVVEGNDVYVQTIAEWGEISVGAFLPTAITETWSGDSGPVTVSYQLDGEEKTLSPAYLEDWIDPGILVPINESIEGSGRRFELYKAFDQTALVMVLTDEERRAFEGRSWCFE
jgi:hypothetical protein